MKNFQLIASGVDVLPLLHSVQVQKDLWDENVLRTGHELTPHKEVSDIWLRFQDLALYSDGGVSRVVDDHESIAYGGWYQLPAAQPIIFDLMRRVCAVRLGRVLITKLSPGGRIAAHVDGGDHAEYYQRYHVVLQSLPGSIFRCGDEIVQMKSGEVWWFDNTVEHEVVNNSADDRIHMILDMRL